MRIGVSPCLDRYVGGIYQYSLRMLTSLDDWKTSGAKHDLVVFPPETGHPIVAELREHGWQVKPAKPLTPKDVLRKLVGEGPHREAWRWLRRRMSERQQKQAGGGPQPETVPHRPDPDDIRWDEKFHRFYRGHGIELMLYTDVGGPRAFEAGIPYVTALHDMQHRLQPELPEVSAHGEWEWREYYYRNCARYATLVLADSEVGKEDILNFYGPHGVTPDRVKVLPYLPAHYLAVDVSLAEQQRVRAAHKLPERYVFYPAQFWPHKNHARIVEALGMLKQQHGLEIPAVFSGFSHDRYFRKLTYEKVVQTAEQWKVSGQIHYLGYVSDADISALYAGATALVMPTFCGPTNIPPLEAWAFGCPVLTSDIRGIREQMGDAAVLADPRSSEAIADGIRRLWESESLRRELATRGRKRLSGYTPEDFRRRLIAIVEEAVERVRAGNTPRFEPPACAR